MSIRHAQGGRSAPGHASAVSLLRLAAGLTTLVLGFATVQPLGVQARQGSLQPLTAEQAKAHLGEIATVCGTVASAKYAATSRGAPTFLNLDRPYPQHIFTVVIWGPDRPKLGTPETEYWGKRICVTGRIRSYQGTPQIFVEDKAQITVPGTADTPQGQAVPPTSLGPSAGKRQEGDARLRPFIPGHPHTVRPPVILQKEGFARARGHTTEGESGPSG